MDVLNLLRARFAERSRTASETVSVAARKVANDQSVDHAALEAAMVATGTTVDAFAELVELHRRRAEWRGDYEKLKDATAKAKKANGALEREQAAFYDYRDKHAARVSAIDAELRQANATVERGRMALHNLTTLENVPAPASDALRDAQAELAAALANVSSATAAVREATQRIAGEEAWIKDKADHGDNHMSSKADHEVALKRWQRRLVEANGALIAAQNDEKAAEAKVAAAEREAIAA
jgi:chromosome segregation ATPase